jgi:hypothetical protein
VMPSGGEVGEPCGISQQEAHAGGTPVIAHHQDGLIRTVADRDFGDTHSPHNGIKFDGFRGDALLDALLDAMQIYTTDQRRAYRDSKGNPRKLKYSDLSFNAFRTDHRWLRVLHDYALMYSFIQDTALPEHLHAVQLIAKFAAASNDTLSTVILREGLTVADGVSELISALKCEISSVRWAAARALKKLCEADDMTYHVDVARHLRCAADSADTRVSQVAKACLHVLEGNSSP